MTSINQEKLQGAFVWAVVLIALVTAGIAYAVILLKLI